MKYQSFIIFLILILGKCQLHAQSNLTNDLDTYIQNVRIGLVDEFFWRFNGDTSHPDIELSNDSTKRTENLIMLFDLSGFTSPKDSAFIEAQKMTEIIIRDSIKINYCDTSWVALAHCKGTLENKEVKFDLFLTVEQRSSFGQKWSITQVDGDFLGIETSNNNSSIMILPDDHETNFLSLRRITSEQPQNIVRFINKNREYEKLSVFLYLIYNNKLKISYVENLEFIFTQVPGYIFHIKYLNRETNNSGWLISNFYRSDDNNKKSFLNYVYKN